MKKVRTHKTITNSDLIISGKEMLRMVYEYDSYHGVLRFSEWMNVSKNTVVNYSLREVIPISWAQGLTTFVGGLDHFRIILNQIRKGKDDATIQDTASHATATPIPPKAPTQEPTGETSVRTTPLRKTRQRASKSGDGSSTVRNFPEMDGATGV